MRFVTFLPNLSTLSKMISHPRCRHDYGKHWKKFTPQLRRVVQQNMWGSTYHEENTIVAAIFLFYHDIRAFKQYNARSKAIAIEKKLTSFCFSYDDHPIKIDEVSSEQSFAGKDQYSPILACKTKIFTGLATKLSKAVK